MASRTEARVVLAAAVAQGVALGDVPRREHGVHQPDRVRPDAQRLRRDVRSPGDRRGRGVDPGRVAGATRRHAPGLPGRHAGQRDRDDPARHQRDLRARRRCRVPAPPVRDVLARRRLRLHGPRAQHVHRRVQPRDGRLVDPRAQRAAGCRHRARATAGRDLHRPRLLVGTADPRRRRARVGARRQPAVCRSRSPDRPRVQARRVHASPAASGSTPGSRSATASARP